MSRKFLRVAKVGGSLFSFKELPMALRCWLDAQPGVSILVAGGGPFADAVREVSATFALDDATAHRLAIGGMQGSAELLGALLPESPLIHSLADVFERLPSHGAVVLNPAKILNQPECQLPQSWDVTSDSIAAYIADELAAHELVLFKSTLLPPNTNRTQAADCGLVDKYFIQAAASFPTVRWVNLRDTPFTERLLS